MDTRVRAPLSGPRTPWRRHGSRKQNSAKKQSVAYTNGAVRLARTTNGDWVCKDTGTDTSGKRVPLCRPQIRVRGDSASPRGATSGHPASPIPT